MDAVAGREAHLSLSIVPFLPDADAERLAPDDGVAWRDAVTLLGVPALDEAVPLLSPFASLATPAIGKEPASVPPPTAYRSPGPTHMPVGAPTEPRAAIGAWRAEAGSLTGADRTYWSTYALAQRHARCLAVDAARPDVPLLELRALAAATATCLSRSRRESEAEPELALLVADMSGIQSYLFQVSEVGAGGVARSLRARSFFLSQVTSLFARRLLDQTGLGPANLVLDAGGKFYVLLPPTPLVLDALSSVRDEAARWALNEMQGELAINLALTRFAPGSLREGRFSEVWARADAELANCKRQRLADALRNDAGWRTESFLRPPAFATGDPCAACGRFSRVSGEEKCAWCLADEQRGRALTRAEWVAYRKAASPAKGDITAFGWSAAVGPGKPPDDGVEVVLFDAPTETARVPYRFIARHVPTNAEGHPLTFEDIAAHAVGRPYLGYLKADVDRLGERIALGLCREGEPSLDSPARIANLSRSLEEFFAGHLEQMLRESFPLCYVVFSGGDDLTVVGPHDAILRLALRVNADFRAYLAYPAGRTRPTDVLTLSAGLAFAPYRRPLSVAVKLAQEALDAAKDHGRARLHLFGRSIAWASAQALCDELWKPDGEPTPLGAELLDSRGVPSAFVQHLLKYARMWDTYRAGDTRDLRYQPLLAYEIARNVDQRTLPHTHAWASRLAQIPLNAGAPGWRESMDTLGVFARLVLLNRRDGDAGAA